MIYQIQVQGNIDASWSDWFSGMKISTDTGVTTLTGQVGDQAVLRGMLNHLWDLNLILIAVLRIEADEK